MTRGQWLKLASKRLTNVLSARVVANARTLESKISDAGPHNQRVQPHILTEARQTLENQGEILRTGQATAWYYLKNTPHQEVKERLAELEAIHNQLLKQSFNTRLGQSLEIAVYRSLIRSSPFEFFGAFLDLDEHDDSMLYSKEEPPSVLKGEAIPSKKKLDFLLLNGGAGRVGVEVKNIREWLYPHSPEIRDLLTKCCPINAVPVLIARRIPYVSYQLLGAAGCILHQTFNQRFPASDSALAQQVKHKDLLGYHDIRLGNQPDDRLLTFVSETLPQALAAARERFHKSKDVLAQYASLGISYDELSDYLTPLAKERM